MSGASPGKSLRAVDAEASPRGRAAAEAAAPPSREYQRLWFSLLRHPWKSLAVVPVSAGGASREVATALCAVGQIHSHSPLLLFDAQGLELKQVASLIGELAAESRQAERYLIVLDSLLENLAGVPIARAADAVLLCVELERADFGSARRTVELVGAERILGSVAVGPGSAP